MTEKQWGLIIVVPMILATAALLVRQRALGIPAALLIAVATLSAAAFLFLTLEN